jgi:hypothetical protein
MLSPTIVEQIRNGAHITSDDKPVNNVPTMDAPTIAHERDVYDADPCGGSPSRY